jgi:hypothetical protein
MNLSRTLELQIEAVSRGEAPPCPDALFQRGEVVLVRRCKRLEGLPHEAAVLGAIPGVVVTYLLLNELDLEQYLVREKDLTPTGKSVEIGSVKREGAAA